MGHVLVVNSPVQSCCGLPKNSCKCFEATKLRWQELPINNVFDPNQQGGGKGKGDSYYNKVTVEQSLRQAVEDNPKDELAMQALADYYEEQGQDYVAEQIRRRQELLEEVGGLGQFHGGEIYAPYYYEMVLDGHGENEYDDNGGDEDEDDDYGPGFDGSPPVVKLDIDEQDRMIFPEIDPNHDVIRVHESDQGFVRVVASSH